MDLSRNFPSIYVISFVISLYLILLIGSQSDPKNFSQFFSATKRALVSSPPCTNRNGQMFPQSHVWPSLYTTRQQVPEDDATEHRAQTKLTEDHPALLLRATARGGIHWNRSIPSDSAPPFPCQKARSTTTPTTVTHHMAKGTGDLTSSGGIMFGPLWCV